MAYEVKNFDRLLNTKGFSDNLLKTHFTLYQGYVTNINKLIEIIPKTTESAELKRRFGWEFNGMRLHELYFENISKNSKVLDKNSKLYKQIVEDFGSYDNWVKDFKATGSMRGIGWAILYYDFIGRKLFNIWINEHDVGHLTIARPILVMDVFEHAYMLDYGTKRADYIETFFSSIDWDTLSERFK